MSFQAPRSIWQRAFSVLLACSLLGFAGCRSDRVSVNPKDPNSPQYAYRLDELALLRMSADDILDMERKKQYGQIYDEYASDAFKNGVSRRRFLIMSNCVETYLGAMEEFDPNELGFHRDVVKGQKSQGDTFLDVLTRKVQRIQGTIEEQLVFAPNGLNFKLNGLYWIAKDKQFLQCIAESPQVEASTTPKEKEATGSPEPGSSEQPVANQAASGETPKGEDTGKTGEQGSHPAAETGPEAEPTKQAELAAPVQEMKPAEIRKQPLEARPAGAGAVIDQRPSPKKPRKIQLEDQPGQATGDATNKTSAPIPGSGGNETKPANQPPIPGAPDESRH